MVVVEKIEEAKYFLDKTKNAVQRKDFTPNLSAFLCATRSIPDYLLEDYNIKYGLRISLKDELYIPKFEKVAREKNNPNAIAFIKGYNKAFKKVKKDEIGKLLLYKRNIKVHRTDIPIQANFSVSHGENVDSHDSVAMEVRDEYGNLKKKSSSRDDKDNKPELKKQSTSNTKVKWFFEDYKGVDVVELCEEFLKLMKNFAENVTTKFP